MPVKMTKESGGKDITSSCGVYLGGRIGREALGGAVLEEGSPMAPISGYEEGYL